MLRAEIAVVSYAFGVSGLTFFDSIGYAVVVAFLLAFVAFSDAFGYRIEGFLADRIVADPEERNDLQRRLENDVGR